MGTKHTPGPWRHGFTMQNLNRMVRTDAGLICTLTNTSRYTGQDKRYDEELKEAEANAKLIASAPEMLDALISIEEYVRRSLTLSGHSQLDIEIILEDVRSAIKKATE